MTKSSEVVLSDTQFESGTRPYYALTDNWIGFAEPCDGPECFDDAVRELIEERLSRDAEAAQPPEPAWQTWLLELERRAKDHEHD